MTIEEIRNISDPKSKAMAFWDSQIALSKHEIAQQNGFTENMANMIGSGGRLIIVFGVNPDSVIKRWADSDIHESVVEFAKFAFKQMGIFEDYANNKVEMPNDDEINKLEEIAYHQAIKSQRR